MKRRTAVMGAALVVFIVFYIMLQLYLPYSLPGGGVEIEISRGMSFREATSILHEHGLLRSSRFFIALGRLTGLHMRLIPGRYSFEGRLNQWRVYRALKDGDVLPSGITVVEGDSLREIKSKLIEEDLMSGGDFDRLSTDPAFMERLGIKAGSLEGYLFPDTYRFYKGESPEVIFETMVRRLWEMYDPGLLERTKAIGWDVHRVLSLASIIEREAVLDSERSLISAVYHNRLRKGIRLQADPTAIYGVKPLSAGVLREDIARKTPYNTYTFRGLPPGPIASPGIKSIRAALFPAEAPYLYFVSDNNGGHTFSSTHREHMKAVRAYRSGKKTR